jgi:hypothetical protein
VLLQEEQAQQDREVMVAQERVPMHSAVALEAAAKVQSDLITLMFILVLTAVLVLQIAFQEQALHTVAVEAAALLIFAILMLEELAALVEVAMVGVVLVTQRLPLVLITLVEAAVVAEAIFLTALNKVKMVVQVL